MTNHIERVNPEQGIENLFPEYGQYHNDQGVDIWEETPRPTVIQKIYNTPEDDYPAVIHVRDAKGNLIGVYPSPFQLGIALLAGLVEEADIK